MMSAPQMSPGRGEVGEVLDSDREMPDLPRLPPGYDCRGGKPELVADELLSIVRGHMAAHPRSLQAAIGPSEIGTPCTRRLGYKLLEVEPVNPRQDAWKPAVGTAIHSYLQAALQAFNDEHIVDRFYLEERVDVGEIGGQTITGCCDVYDRFTATVIDWKTCGPTVLKAYRKNGPSQQYRAQAHLYGRGYIRAGLPVENVGVLFLPRNGELREAYYWTEPYDEQVALDALTRADGVAALARTLGRSVLPMLPTEQAYCTSCDYFLPGITDVAEGCPGHVAPPISVGTQPAASAAPAA